MNLTIDIGTTNTKVSLWDNESTTQPTEQLKFKTPKIENGDNIDFDADKLFDDILGTICQFKLSDRSKVQKISIASVGESGVLIDEKGNRASEMIAWYDNRSQSVIDRLTPENRQTIYDVAGLPPHAHYSASKIRWLFDNGLDSTKRYTWLCIPDFIAYKFTGMMRTEYSIASRTMVFDLEHKRWSSRIKKIFGIENVNFPEALVSGEKVATLKQDVANGLSLSGDTYVTIAGHDHMVGSFSSDQRSDELLDSTGTTEGILLLSNQLKKNPHGEQAGIAYGIYINPALYTTFTALPSAGSVIQWFIESYHLTDEVFMNLMNEAYDDYLAGKILPEEINFVIPHFSGSGSPVKSTETRGLWYGLTNQTSLKNLVFGLFLGLTFELKHAVETLTDSPIRKVKLIGPATKDPLWIQLRADLLNAKIRAMDTPEAVSRGANIVAEAVTRKYQNLDEAPSDEYTPKEDNPLVERLLYVYEKQYKALYNSKIEYEL